MTADEIRDAYHEHKDSLYRFAWRMTASESAAEDIVQECFVALLRRPDAYDAARGPLRPFLIAMARNQAWKRWRGERRWTELIDEDGDALQVQTIDPAAASALASSVGRAVQALPPLQREALVLFEYEGLTLEEIARTVEAEIGTVKARLHRARENLRRILAPVRSAGLSTGRKHGTVE